jgi:hypothetical protein
LMAWRNDWTAFTSLLIILLLCMEKQTFSITSSSDKHVKHHPVLSSCTQVWCVSEDHHLISVFRKGEGGKRGLNGSYAIGKTWLYMSVHILSNPVAQWAIFFEGSIELHTISFIITCERNKKTVCLNDQRSCTICVTNLQYHLYLRSKYDCLFGVMILATN